jgi:hypothetical protein
MDLVWVTPSPHTRISGITNLAGEFRKIGIANDLEASSVNREVSSALFSCAGVLCALVLLRLLGNHYRRIRSGTRLDVTVGVDLRFGIPTFCKNAKDGHLLKCKELTKAA